MTSGNLLLTLLKNSSRLLLLPRHFSTFRSLLEAAERAKQRHAETNDGSDDDDRNKEEKMRSEVKLGKMLDDFIGGGTSSSVDDPDDPLAGRIDWRVFDLEAKLKEHERMLHELATAGDADVFGRWMTRIDSFEEKNFRLPFYGSEVLKMVNRFHAATGEQRLDLYRKIDRAFRIVHCQDAHDPKIRTEVTANDGLAGGFVIERQGDEEYSELEGRDDLLLRKLVDIESKVEEKLAKFHRTTGGEKNETQQQHKYLPRPPNKLQGFDVKFIDVYKKRNAKKDGDVVKFMVCLACGNYRGTVGFAEAEDPDLMTAIWKTHGKCFQNLHYVERHDERTIVKPLHSGYGKTKIYLWPAPQGKGMKGSRLVQTILSLAGFKDVRSKVIGWINPIVTIMALLKALDATKVLEDS